MLGACLHLLPCFDCLASYSYSRLHEAVEPGFVTTRSLAEGLNFEFSVWFGVP